MSGLQRFMDVLYLFSVENDAWTIQTMANALSVPQSTVYRTVRDLVKAGLLEPTLESHYRLGAAFVEFDRKIRLTDPLIRVGQPILRDIIEQAHIPCVGLLSRLYDKTVMCVADETYGAGNFQSSYERGRPMPLTRGATSKAILAQLPARRLTKILETHADNDISTEDFRAMLLEIRKRGYCITRGEIDHGLIGIAAPVIGHSLGLVASLSLVVQTKEAGPTVERRLVMLLMSAGKLLTEALVHSI
jgi:DNA-binding IclR family transcriptional regulator